jgi:uracil-DNA glycosylase family 4
MRRSAARNLIISRFIGLTSKKFPLECCFLSPWPEGLFYLSEAALPITIASMDIKKVIRQHSQMEEFFSGGFVAKGQSKADTRKSDTDRQAALDAIAAEVAKCCCCGLDKTRRHVVPGEGSAYARIVFVGEAPGADEDEKGRPFVGRAGQKLTDIIEAMGLHRSDVFICNVLKCRPPENRNPKAEEIVACMPYLERQLEIIKPEVIVALGTFAAQALLKSVSPIGQLRGKFHEYYTQSGYGPIKLMPTYHPSYIIRNYTQETRRRVWEDMQKVCAKLDIPIPKK